MAEVLMWLGFLALGLVLGLAFRVWQVFQIERRLNADAIDARERSRFLAAWSKQQSGPVRRAPGARPVNPDARRLYRRVYAESMALGANGLLSVRGGLGALANWAKSSRAFQLFQRLTRPENPR